MKQFVSAISTNSSSAMEPKLFNNVSGNPLLDHPVSYGLTNAILVPMANAAEEGETVRVTLMLTTETPASEASARGGCEALCDASGTVRQDVRVTCDTNANLKRFAEELKLVAEEKKFAYTIDYVMIPRLDSAENHLLQLRSLFAALRPDKDETLRELYTDITYGMTPATIITQMAYRHITQEYPNVKLCAMLYVQFIRGAERQVLSDLSYLLHIDRTLQYAQDMGFGESEELFSMLGGLQ